MFGTGKYFMSVLRTYCTHGQKARITGKTIHFDYTCTCALLFVEWAGVTWVLIGWLSDRSWVDCLLVNNLCLIVGGLATIACPFCTNFALLAAYSVIFGSCIGNLSVICMATFLSLFDDV